MASTIKLKNGSGAPTSGQLVQGEPALDLTNKRLYTEDSGGNVIEVGINPSSLTTSSADINGGTIDGTVIGGSSAAAGSFTTISASGEIAANGGVAFGDNDKATFGASDDLQILHTGTNSDIRDLGTGALRLIGADIQFLNADFSDFYAKFINNGAAEFYYDGAAKLATTSTGIDVTGTVTADGLTVNKGSDGTDIVSLTGASAGRFLNIQSFTNLSSVGAGYELDATSGQGAIRLATAGTPRVFVDATGDISFYEDTGTTAKFFWDASAESLGIGTTSPSASLHVNSGAVNTVARFESTDATAVLHFFDSGTTGANYLAVTTHDMSFGTNATERMRIDSSGNVGIGTASPDSKLEISNAGTVNWKLTNTTASIETASYTSSVGGSIGTITNHPFSLFTNSITQVTVDTSGNVGIGTSSPASQADISKASGGDSVLSLTSAGVQRHQIIQKGTGDGGLVFYNQTAGSERMRIDSSGNLLVGTTDTNPANDASGTGVALGAGGWVAAARDGDTSGMFNRLTSDGNIVSFAKDGSTVGSIGSSPTTSQTYFAGTSRGVTFGSSTLYPCSNTGSGQDAQLDIGSGTYRFKDLYLSGGVYLGGTGAANKLDDYEEGTFTPELRDATSGGNTATTTHKYGHYTKVGNLVTIWMHFRNIDTTGMTSGNVLYITGLPFTADNNLYTAGAVSTDRVSFTGNYLTFSVTENTAYGPISIINSNAQDASLLVSGIDGTGSDIQGICIQYRTA